MQNFTMPPPPAMPYNGAQYAYDVNGNPIQAYTYPPQYNMYQQPVVQPQPVYAEQSNMNSAVDFSGLIGSTNPLPIHPVTPGTIITERKKPTTRRKTKETSKDTDIEVVDNEDPVKENVQMVEAISYADTYEDTNNLLRETIAQTNQLAQEVKVELDRVIKSGNLKGKSTYIANLSSALNGILSTKVTAIREINSSIRNINEAEYRRYKDIRSAADTQDDARYIMSMNDAYLRLPVGSPGSTYFQPNTLEITSGLNGIIKADTLSPEQRDAGFNNFMNNLTPEQNYMIVGENNPNIKEVIVYDYATGQKYFDWIDSTTGESIPNLPKTDPNFMEDFVIDPRTRMAKNTNLRTSMPVIYKNENVMNEY